MEYILAIIISGGIAGGVVFFFSQRKITKLNSDLQAEKGKQNNGRAKKQPYS